MMKPSGLIPISLTAWDNKGIALNAQSKFDEAIKAHDEAIRLNPKYAAAWYNKADDAL